MRNKPKASKRETLNVRVKSEDRNLIDRAARLLGKSRTDFLLEYGEGKAHGGGSTAAPESDRREQIMLSLAIR